MALRNIGLSGEDWEVRIGGEIRYLWATHLLNQRILSSHIDSPLILKLLLINPKSVNNETVLTDEQADLAYTIETIWLDGMEGVLI